MSNIVGGDKPMNCRKVERLLSAYWDNMLKENYMAQIKAHLVECEKCSDELNAMMKIEQLLKLKTKERPSEEYFENYWQRLKGKLDRNAIPRLSEDRRLNNSFMPRFAFAFNGILIALLIFLGGLLYAQNQQIKSLQFVQEEIQKEMYKNLFHLRTRVNTEVNVSILDKYLTKEL